MKSTCFHRVERTLYFRILGYGLILLSPDDPPLFSERNGHRKPWLKIGMWRVLPLRPVA